MRHRIVFALATASAVVVARPASATDCSGLLSPCVDSDILWPHAGPAHFQAVGSADTVAERQLGFGLVAAYLSRPLVIALRSPGNSSDQYAVDDQVNTTFLWSYGVTNRLELDFALPLTVVQSGTGLAPVTGGNGLNDTSVRDLRFGFAYALVARRRIDGDPHPDPCSSRDTCPDNLGLVGRLEVSAPSGDRSQFAGERSGTFVPSLAADYQRGRWFAGAELGLRVRPTTELLGTRIGSQVVTSMGIGANILRHELLSATLEAWALPDLVGQDTLVLSNGRYTNQSNGQVLVPAEWMLSIRTAPVTGGDLSIQLGGGGALPLTDDSVLSPRWRFVLSLRWDPLAHDTHRTAAP